MPYHVRAEETLERPALLELQRTRLAALLARVKGSNAFYQRKLADLTFDPMSDPIERLPFTTRDELQADQTTNPPYGTNHSAPLATFVRLHQTSGSTIGGPLRWLDTTANWQWWMRCWANLFRAAGVTADDVLFYPFSFGPFIGFWGAFEAALALGNRCLAAGGMSTSARLRHLLDNRATVVCCTPTYALHMAEVAATEGLDLRASDVRSLIVAGEPGGNLPATRSAIERAWAARVFDHAGMTEIGPWGFEAVEAPGRLYVMENEFIAEVIDPQTAAPQPLGETGELVLTNLGRLDSPLIRYRTGDQVRLQPSDSERSFHYADGGVLGRIDDMLIIRGNNVFPGAIEDTLRAVPGLVEYRLHVARRGALVDLRVTVEPHPESNVQDLRQRVADAIKDRFNFRPAVDIADVGALPRFEMKAKRLVREEE